MHLATRGNNKILRTPPPHISSSEEIFPRLTLAQFRTNKSPFLKSYLHKVDAKSHPSPLCPLCNTHTSSLQLHSNTHHIVTPGFVDRPPRSDCTACQMDGEAGWWTRCRKIRLHTLARVMRASRQQQLEWPPLPQRRHNLFCFTKLLMVWHKCHLKAYLLKHIRALEENTI